MTDLSASRHLILKAFDELSIRFGQLPTSSDTTELQLKFALLRQAVEGFISRGAQDLGIPSDSLQ